MDSELPQGPPAGFRKTIPVLVKLQVVIRQNSRCTACGEHLGRLEDAEFDHVPAIQLRCWDADEKDTIPKSNDPEFIFAKHVRCHAEKTFGRVGGSKRGSDVTEIARTKRIAKDTLEFRRKMLAKSDPSVGPPEPKRKKRWPSRPFPKRKDNKSKKRHQRA